MGAKVKWVVEQKDEDADDKWKVFQRVDQIIIQATRISSHSLQCRLYITHSLYLSGEQQFNSINKLSLTMANSWSTRSSRFDPFAFACRYSEEGR